MAIIAYNGWPKPRSEIDGAEVGRIGPGLLVLLGVSDDDEDADADSYLVAKMANLYASSPTTLNRFNLSNYLDVGDIRDLGREKVLHSTTTPIPGAGADRTLQAPRPRTKASAAFRTTVLVAQRVAAEMMTGLKSMRTWRRSGLYAG